VGNILRSSLVSDSYDKLLVLDILQNLFLHDLLLWSLLCFLDYLCAVYYNEVPDYIVATHYFTVVVLHIAAMVLQNVAHCYTVVVLETDA